MTPPPEQTHDRIIARLNRLLTAHLISSGDTGRLFVPRAAIWTDPHTYIEPDLFYVSADLEARLDPARRTTADLVIEVLSPGSAIYDRNTKADTYGALGVRELWLVDETAETVEVRQRSGQGFAAGRVFSGSDGIESCVFPNLRLPVARLFKD